MGPDTTTIDTDLIASQGAWLKALYDQIADQIAALTASRHGADPAKQASAYRSLRNPILGQTTPANGIDVADRAVLSLVHSDRAKIVAGAEAGMRLLLALLEANRRRAYEGKRQSEERAKLTSDLPPEHQYLFGELTKRGVTRSMLDTLTSEELDVLAQLIQQKNDNPTHATLKGLWNFTYRCGIVDHKVVGLTADERDAIRIVSQVNADAGMAAQTFFNDAAGRKLDIPAALALALLADLRAKKRSRGLRRTADQVAADDYNRTSEIILSALGLRDDQVDELFAARNYIFDHHFEKIEHRRAEADAERREEIEAYIPAAQTMLVREAQAAAAYYAQTPPRDDDLDGSEAEGADGGRSNRSAGEPGKTASDSDSKPNSDELLPDIAQQQAAMAQDRRAFASSNEKIEKLEDVDRATLLRDYPHIRAAARQSGIAMPGDDPPTGPPFMTTVVGDSEPRAADSQPLNERERRARYLKGLP